MRSNGRQCLRHKSYEKYPYQQIQPTQIARVGGIDGEIHLLVQKVAEKLMAGAENP
jgi:hypothetical protein